MKGSRCINVTTHLDRSSSRMPCRTHMHARRSLDTRTSACTHTLKPHKLAGVCVETHRAQARRMRATRDNAHGIATESCAPFAEVVDDLRILCGLLRLGLAVGSLQREG